MAREVTIDIVTRFIDNATSEAKATEKSIKGIEKAAEEAQKDVDKLGKKKANPKVGVDSTSAMKKLGDLDKKLNKIGRSKTEAKLSVLDRASAVIDKVTAKAKAFGGKTYGALVKLRDSNVLSSLNKMSTGLKSLTGKAWSVAVRIKDGFTAPLRALRNSLFNIRNLIAGIATAWAASKIFGGAINVADAYSSAKISFSTLLGEAQGQQMMDNLDAFAKATPFNTTNVIANAQKMLAMGWDAENIITDMEVIGNAAAATGKLDQGLESIVRALSQIKTKGKLSTEELNQLAEAGIAAKAMLAEQLGYGTGDAGIAAMTKDLEDGAIASDVAIQALLAGMQRYDGMMESMANETVEGLWSQMQDAFSINIIRKWGQGLQDGAKRGLGAVVDLLDEAEESMAKVGDLLYDIGKNLSNWAADKLENAIKRITTITGTSEFQNASIGGKVSLLWNGVVVDPLKEWWENGGQAKTAETAGMIGGWMGEAITGGLLAIFGVTDILDESNFEVDENGNKLGMSVAQSFVDGFKENFDGQAITDAFVDAISDVWDAIPWWAKALVGTWAAGTAAGGISKLAGGITAGLGTAATTAGSATAMTGVLGYGTSAAINLGAGNLAGGASASAGALAAAGLGATAGGIAGAAAAGKGIYDLYGSHKAYKAGDTVEGKAKSVSGVWSLGGVGMGAATGAALGSVIPGLGTAVGALIGAGLGGLAGWFGGNAQANKIRDLETTVGVNITGEKHIQNTIEVLAEDFGIPEEHADTVALLLTGDKELLNKIDVSKLAEEFGIPESQAQTIIEELTAAKSIENRLEVLAGDFGVPDSISKTISVNITAIAGKVKSFVSGIFGKEDGAGYRGGIFGGTSAMEGFAQGGIVGGSTRFIRVNEEAPEMVIPLSSQRRDRALSLWAKTGELLDVPGFARGGNTGGDQDEGIRHLGSGNAGATEERGVQVNMGGFTFEINVSGSNTAEITEAIKGQMKEIAEGVAGIMADAIGGQFENTPVRGGAE